MALIKCQDCNNAISSSVTNCPYCGGPVDCVADQLPKVELERVDSAAAKLDCSRELDARKCECPTKVTTENQSQQLDSSSKPRHSRIYIVLSIFIIFFAALNWFSKTSVDFKNQNLNNPVGSITEPKKSTPFEKEAGLGIPVKEAISANHEEMDYLPNSLSMDDSLLAEKAVRYLEKINLPLSLDSKNMGMYHIEPGSGIMLSEEGLELADALKLDTKASPQSQLSLGYRDFNFIRAFFVEKRQSTPFWDAFLLVVQIFVSFVSVFISGILRSRHCLVKTLNSHSAMFSQLPCLGV